MELKEGEQGIYRGTVEIANRRYGIMEQENQSAKLIAADHLESRQKDKEMVIEKQIDYKGHEKLKGIQPEVRERERSRDRGLEIGGF